VSLEGPLPSKHFPLQKGAVGKCFVFSKHLASFFFQIFPMILTKYHKKKRKRKILPKLYGGMGSLLGSWQTYILHIAKFGYICLIEVTT
jgi:hypothetical protein